MLGFAARPDPAFRVIVTAALEIATDELRNPDASDENALVNYSTRTQAIFNRQELLAELEKLLEAHRSPTTYKLTGYHFLILHDVLQVYADLHNDSLELHDGVRRWGDVTIRKIDLDTVLAVYFFDTDFLFAPDVFNALDEQRKEEMQFADEAWGVVNQLKPHPDELALQEASPDFFPSDPHDEHRYEPGQDYPVDLREE